MEMYFAEAFSYDEEEAEDACFSPSYRRVEQWLIEAQEELDEAIGRGEDKDRLIVDLAVESGRSDSWGFFLLWLMYGEAECDWTRAVRFARDVATRFPNVGYTRTLSLLARSAQELRAQIVR